MHGYQNTSLKNYAATGDETWTLPYRAAMVWPIRIVTDQPRQAESPGHFTGHQDIIGFLTIDTVATNVFCKDVDFEVGALLADALYIFLDSVIPQTQTPPRNNIGETAQ